MALEDLANDLKSNTAEAKRLFAVDPDNPLLSHLVNTMWPFQEAIIQELNEQADALDDMIDQTGDMLQAETAGKFAALIIASAKLCDELDRKLQPSDLELRGFIKATRDLNSDLSAILEEITVPPLPDDETTEDAEGDDDDDDDDRPAKH